MRIDRDRRRGSRRRILEAALAAALVGGAAPSASAQTKDDILTRARARYASLTSYADSGRIVTELQVTGGPLVKERFRFVTFYHGPRQYFHDFEAEASGGDRVVIWCDGGDFFETWWKATKVHDRYPKGQGANAFALTAYPTKGSALQMAPALFSKAGLHGPLSDLADYHVVGTEEIDGRRYTKVTGQVTLTYRNGNGGRPRPTTLWIDPESLLVVKIVEDTPTDAPSGSVNRTTTTFVAKADPTIPASKFRFDPPK